MSRKKNFAEKQAERLAKASKLMNDFLVGQETLGIVCDSKDVGDNACCLDVSYDNADMKFSGDSTIQKLVDAEDGSVTHTGQQTQDFIGAIRPQIILAVDKFDCGRKYAFALVDELTGMPFHVGACDMSMEPTEEFIQHQVRKLRGSHKEAVKSVVEHLEENLTDAEAKDKVEFLTRVIGTIDNESGPLTN